MAGEIATLNGQLALYYNANITNSLRIEGYLQHPTEISNDTKIAYLHLIAQDYVNVVKFLGQAMDATSWLDLYGTWFLNVDIDNLISIIRGDVSSIIDKVVDSVLGNSEYIISKLDDILADLRFSIFPELSHLESFVRKEITDLSAFVFTSLTDTKNLIADQIGNQITTLSKNVDTLENTITESHNKTVGQVEADLNRAQLNIVDTITDSENRISNDIGVATGLLGQGILATQMHIEKTFINTVEELSKAFASFADDIAKRIWEYFRDFVFERV